MFISACVYIICDARGKNTRDVYVHVCSHIRIGYIYTDRVIIILISFILLKILFNLQLCRVGC